MQNTQSEPICPCCGQSHQVCTQKVIETSTEGGIQYSYETEYHYCVLKDEYFITEPLLKQNEAARQAAKEEKVS